MSERYDDVIREYIDFVNEQVGTYMDSLAGFAGHYTNAKYDLNLWQIVFLRGRSYEIPSSD